MNMNVESSEPGELEKDEREELEEQAAEAREQEQLTKNKKKNYAMLRALVPIAKVSVGAHAFSDLWEFLDFYKKIMLFRQWQAVEGGVIQVRENPGKADGHGYAVIRPYDDPQHDIYLRVWNGFINTVIIMPRMDGPLPRQGPERDLIMSQMQLLSGVDISKYMIWLKRMKKVELPLT